MSILDKYNLIMITTRIYPYMLLAVVLVLVTFLTSPLVAQERNQGYLWFNPDGIETFEKIIDGVLNTCYRTGRAENCLDNFRYYPVVETPQYQDPNRNPDYLWFNPSNDATFNKSIEGIDNICFTDGIEDFCLEYSNYYSAESGLAPPTENTENTENTGNTGNTGVLGVM